MFCFLNRPSIVVYCFYFLNDDSEQTEFSGENFIEFDFKFGSSSDYLNCFRNSRLIISERLCVFAELIAIDGKPEIRDLNE